MSENCVRRRPLTLALSDASHGPFAETRLDALYRSYQPASLSRPDLLDSRYLLATEGRYQVYFAPIAAIPEPTARLLFVGLTPGFNQLLRAAQLSTMVDEAQRRNALGFSRLLTANVAFAGSMRANLCTMLDAIGLGDAMNVGASAQLFMDSRHVATTSALVYPVFGQRGEDFSGIADLSRLALFREMISALLYPRLALAPHALLVPLGVAAESGLQSSAGTQSVPPVGS